MNLKNLNLKYALVNIGYMLLVSGSLGFAYNYLSQSGFDDGTIGTVMSLVSLFGVFLGPAAADIVDRSDKITQKMFITASMVVCGGFAAPIREGYAEKVLIVTSGEKMALYAANNINNAVKNFADRNYAKVRGVVMNRRAVENEEEKVRKFAGDNNLEIVADIPRSNDIIHFEDMGKTVIEGDRTLEVSQRFIALAKMLIEEE